MRFDMRYFKFIIKNFKGIKDLTIDLSQRPNSRVYTFVGLNESGKTTILEAINTINTGYNRLNAHRLIPKHLKANFTGNVSVKAIVSVEQEDNELIAAKFKELGYINYQPIDSFTTNFTCKFEGSKAKGDVSYWDFRPVLQKSDTKEKVELTAKDDDWQTMVSYIQDNLMPRIVFYDSLLFDFPERIYLTGTRSDTNINKPYKDIITDILQDIIPNGTIQGTLLDNFLEKESGGRDVFDAIQTKLESKIGEEVFSSWGQLFNSKLQQASIALRFGIEPNTAETEFYLEIKIKENADLYYISERSIGFRWFFSFLFFILFRKNRKSDLGETLFLLDEPASNLHSAAQKKLLETFRRFVDDQKKPLKLLYTTHSHHMINPQWLEGAYVVKNEAVNYSGLEKEERTTDIKAIPYRNFVSQYPDQQDYYKPILDTLDYQPGLLEKVPNIIVTEGKNDFYTLTYINNVILNRKYKKINLMPGVGCSANTTIIQLYLAWNKKFMILLDGDKAGVKSKGEYIKLFGKAIEDNIKLYGDLVPEIGPVMMEDIFSEEEKLLITQRFNPEATAYNKSAFNTAIQEALAAKNIIELSETTVEKFDNLLKALNEYVF